MRDTMRPFQFTKITCVVATSLFFVACGGGGGGGDPITPQRGNLNVNLIDSAIPSKNTEYFDDVEDIVLAPLRFINTIDNVFSNQTIDLEYTACFRNGEPIANAFYDPVADTAILCDKLTEQHQLVFEIAGHSEESARYGAMHAMNFVAFHELGHAIVLEDQE